MRSLFKNIGRKSNLGLVIDWKFHLKNRWVSAYTPFLVNLIVQQFDPIIVSSQYKAGHAASASSSWREGIEEYCEFYLDN